MKVLSRLGCASVAALTLFATVAGADARPRKRFYGARPTYVAGDRTITVTRRSFLDSGVVAPVGSTNAYVQQITRFDRPPLANYSPGILWRPDPGPGEPLF